jgi:ankyrin repeat protein
MKVLSTVSLRLSTTPRLISGVFIKAAFLGLVLCSLFGCKGQNTSYTERDFLQACKQGDVETADKCLQTGIDPRVKENDDQGMQGVHLAALKGHVQIIELLLQHGAPVDDLSDENLEPIHYAAMGNHTKVAELLMRHGCNLGAVADGISPLYVACRNAKVDMVQWLISNGASTTQELTSVYNGEELIQQAIHGAALGSSPACIKLLIENGASPIALNKLLGIRPIHLACASSSKTAPEAIGLLVKAGASTEEVTSDGMTCLHLAAMGGSDDVIDTLLALGAGIETRDNVGRAPIDTAIENERFQAVRKILSCKVANGYSSMHPLMKAAWKGDTASINKYISTGKNVNQQDTDGWNPLHLAILGNRPKAFRLLIESGLKIQNEVNLKASSSPIENAVSVTVLASTEEMRDLVWEALKD